MRCGTRQACGLQAVYDQLCRRRQAAEAETAAAIARAQLADRKYRALSRRLDQVGARIRWHNDSDGTAAAGSATDSDAAALRATQRRLDVYEEDVRALRGQIAELTAKRDADEALTRQTSAQLEAWNAALVEKVSLR